MNNIAFAILSGGKNSRIGLNKAFLEVKGKAIIENLLDISKNFAQRMIITNNPSDYEKYPVEIYTDIYPNCGPMSGIHSALSYSKFPNIFIISCDMPFIGISTINWIIENHKKADITLTLCGEKVNYVCGVYSRNIHQKLEDYIKVGDKKAEQKNKHFALYNLEKIFQVNIIDFDDNINNCREFTNINTLDQYSQIIS